MLPHDLNEGLEHVVSLAGAVHVRELAQPTVELDQRQRLQFVQLEPPQDRVFGIVLALHNVAAAHIALPVVRRRVVDVVRRATLGAHPATGNAREHDLRGNVEVDDYVEGILPEHRLERQCVRHRLLRGPAASRDRDGVLHPVELFHSVRVGVADERDARGDGLANPGVRQVETFGPAVHLEPRSRLDCGGDDRVEVDGVRIAALQEPPGRVRERGDIRVVHRVDDRGDLLHEARGVEVRLLVDGRGERLVVERLAEEFDRQAGVDGPLERGDGRERFHSRGQWA